MTNILFTEKGIRYIDWEWTGHWDNAFDVALLFDQDFPQEPWKIRLTGEKRRYYLNQYQKRIKDKTLRQRVDVWNNYFRFRDILFFKWKIKNYDKQENNLPKKLYIKHEKKNSKALIDKFGL